jgi:multidrug efflux pump subunit AcrA (membrane-fusion protein)
MRVRLEATNLSVKRESSEREHAVRQCEAARASMAEMERTRALATEELQAALARAQGALAGTEERLRNATRLRELAEARERKMATLAREASQRREEADMAPAAMTHEQSSPLPCRQVQPGSPHTTSPMQAFPQISTPSPDQTSIWMSPRSPMLDDIEELAVYARRERLRFEEITSRHALRMGEIGVSLAPQGSRASEPSGCSPLQDRVQAWQRHLAATRAPCVPIAVAAQSN